MSLLIRRCEMKKTLRRFLWTQLVVCSLVVIGCGGDDAGGNKCEQAKDVRMNAIEAKCAEYSGACCYCNCELSATPGCDCSSWSLYNTEDVSVCEAGDSNNAEGCLNDETMCQETTKNTVAARCL
jgi:hypothetical protein